MRQWLFPLAGLVFLAAPSGAWADPEADALVRQGAEQLHLSHSDRMHGLQHLRAAIDDLEAALRIDPDNAYAHHNLGEAAFQTGKYDFAVEEFSKAIALNPSSARSYLGRANAELALGREDAAGDDYARAGQIDPSLRPVIAQQEASVRADARQRQIAAAQAEYRRTHPSPPPPSLGGIPRQPGGTQQIWCLNQGYLHTRPNGECFH